MLEEVDRLASLVDRLLTWSRAETGQAKLSKEAIDLSELADEVVSHIGVLAEEKNQTLSEARALSCAHGLIKHGIGSKRLVPIGFGDTRPVADNSTEAGRLQNRRVVFIDSERKGKRVGKHVGGQIAGDPCVK